MFTHAHEIRIDDDEGRFVLIVETDEESLVIDIHDHALELAASTGMRHLRAYAAEAESARATMPQRITEDDLDGYDLDDPKRVELQRIIDRGGY